MSQPLTLARICFCCGLLALVLTALGPFSGLLLIVSVISGLGAGIGHIWQSVRRKQLDYGRTSAIVAYLIVGLSAAGMAALIPVSHLVNAEQRVKVSKANSRLREAERTLLSVPGPQREEAARKQTLPVDPFLTSASLHLRVHPDGGFVLWSIGPDRIDQSAALLYDPTNGTVSGGDIVTSGV